MNNKKIRVLWFSGGAIADNVSKGTGSWVFAMRSLVSKEVELYNITRAWDNKDIVYKEVDDMKEYILPNYKLKNGLPSEVNIQKIKQIVDNIQPDIIHIWGIEMYWALLFTRGYLKGNVLLEVQGLLRTCHNVFYGGLTPEEVKRCYSIKEFLKPAYTLQNLYKNYLNRSKYASEILNGFKKISTQSEWTRDQINMLVSSPKDFFYTRRPIRDEFYKSEKWMPKNNKEKIIFSSASYFEPFKGVHFLIKAFSLYAKKVPGATLVLAGVDIKLQFYRINGYTKFLFSLINEYGIKDRVLFPGKLSAKQLTEWLLKSDIYVNPSLVESYSAASAEALYLGVPTIMSYAGAMPEFSRNKKVALYYPQMDFVSLASRIDSLISDKELSLELSSNAISEMSTKCGSELVKKTQLEIYRSLYDEFN